MPWTDWISKPDPLDQFYRELRAKNKAMECYYLERRTWKQRWESAWPILFVVLVFVIGTMYQCNSVPDEIDYRIQAREQME